ncbi:hypothetical protein CC86DRAFT_370431 [Ophiobolus disseminans]|uniref:Uncharacterized protein n=1 Tax=Ophiobolus disseminans TaxID=1469910 RepID=A0A6A6ZZK2_9PLEO|nr:hypothetical protein CC86DRAFT_370431 [Ophiobolus disseminans]
MNQPLGMQYIDKSDLNRLLGTLFPQGGWTIEDDNSTYLLTIPRALTSAEIESLREKYRASHPS